MTWHNVDLPDRPGVHRFPWQDCTETRRGVIIYEGVNQDRAAIRRIDHPSTANATFLLCWGNTDEPPTYHAAIIMGWGGGGGPRNLHSRALFGFLMQRLYLEVAPGERGGSREEIQPSLNFHSSWSPFRNGSLDPRIEIYVDSCEIYSDLQACTSGATCLFRSDCTDCLLLTSLQGIRAEAVKGERVGFGYLAVGLAKVAESFIYQVRRILLGTLG